MAKPDGALSLPSMTTRAFSLPRRRLLWDFVGEDASGAGGADIERLAVQDQMNGFPDPLALDARRQASGCDFENLDSVTRFVCDVKIIPMNDDAADGMAGLAVHVEHDFEPLRRRNVSGGSRPASGSCPRADATRVPGKKRPLGKCFTQMRRDRGRACATSGRSQ